MRTEVDRESGSQRRNKIADEGRQSDCGQGRNERNGTEEKLRTPDFRQQFRYACDIEGNIVIFLHGNNDNFYS